MGERDTLTEPAQRGLSVSTRQPFLFVALECDRPLAGSTRHALATIDEIWIGRGDSRACERTVIGDRTRLVIQIPDRWMSSKHARLWPATDGWMFEDNHSKNGSFLGGEPCTNAHLFDGDLLQLGHTFFLFRAALDTPASVSGTDETNEPYSLVPGVATLLPSLAASFAALKQVAGSQLPVLLQGETGTGKEVIARAIHRLVGAKVPFVPINCGALPANLVESELFGYRKGAFSGAIEDRPGSIRSADGGVLFLDEIGDLPLTSQAAFLRVLQEREVVPLGGGKPTKVDVRLVSATNVDLGAMVERGHFRADLLARISGFTLHLPSLRERREDLGLLIGDILRHASNQRVDDLAIGWAAARVLFAYDWPFNVRELQKCLVSAMLLSQGQTIEIEHLAIPPGRRAAVGPAAPVSARSQPLKEEDARRRDQLVALLAHHRGNVTLVAKAMGRARMQILRWVKRYQIDIDAFRRR